MNFDSYNSSMEHFRKILNEEFVKRTKRNPSFSIRAFAYQLEIEPSSLAQILSGKRKITDKMCDRLGTKLGMSPAKLKAAKKPFKVSFNRFNSLEDDAFKIIADWYYYAILELTTLDKFKPSPLWISRTLGIPFAQTIDAIERLKRLNYLEITEDGKWIDRLGDSINLGNQFKTQAFSEHQKQVLLKAVEAIDKTSYDQRVQSSLTFPISKDKLPGAKTMILNFLEELDEYIKSGDTKDEVYNVSVSLYPLTNVSSGEKND